MLVKRIWNELKNEWKREWREHPIITRVGLVVIPLYMVVQTILLFLTEQKK